MSNFKDANSILQTIAKNGGATNSDNLPSLRMLADFLIKSARHFQDPDCATFCNNFAVLSSEMATVLESKLKTPPSVINIDSSDDEEDNNEDEDDEDTSTIFNILISDEYCSLFMDKFDGYVKVLQSEFEKKGGYRNETIEGQYSIQFGVVKQIIVDLEANMSYDPYEEGSTGDFSGTCILREPGKPDEPLELFSNEEDVDYCTGYGGGDTNFNSAKIIAKFFGLNLDQLKIIWKMIIVALKSIASEEIDNMLNNVDELEIPTTPSRSQQVSTSSGKQTLRSSTTRYGPY